MRTSLKKWLLMLFLVILPYFLYSSSEYEWPIGPWKFSPVDHPQFVNPEFNDSSWNQVRNRAIPRNPIGVKWLRKTLSFPNDAGPVLFSMIDLQSSCEIWWDGQLIGRNGQVGSEKISEIPGTIYFSCLVDGSFTRKGNHVLAIRYSNYNDFSIDNYSIYPSLSIGGTLNTTLNKYLIRLLLNFSICFTAFLIGIALYAGGGRFRPYIYFSWVVLPTAFVFGFFALMYLVNFPSWYLGVKQLLYFILNNGTSFFIMLFFIKYFSVPKKHIYISAMLILLFTDMVLRWNGYIKLFSLSYYVMMIVINLFNLGILFYGIIKKKPGSWIFLPAWLISAAIIPLEMSGIKTLNSYFLYDATFWLFIFVLFFTVTIQLKLQTKIQRALEVRASRLESEILKKAIQPHFLMNTLASLQSWSKRDPEKAARMTQAIAGEYRMINEVVSKNLITIGEEIGLCRLHLDLMGFRRDANYQMICEECCDDEMIPPLVFHTLVENGLTHSMKPKEDGTFWFTCSVGKKENIYKLENNGSLLNGLTSETDRKISEGTGYKYVKSRLEEGFPGRWKIDYGLKEGKWYVEITIKKIQT